SLECKKGEFFMNFGSASGALREAVELGKLCSGPGALRQKLSRVSQCLEVVKWEASVDGALRILLSRVAQLHLFLIARCAGDWRVAPTRFLYIP
ncbi:hypothetical protein A2U01_0070775, partial [Trifolium medium]|nr:hypothetical protein [Trifolium medium]